MGGPSAEHEVSLHSGLEVLKFIDHDTWSVRAVLISREREFFFADMDNKPPLTYDELLNPDSSRSLEGPFSPDNAASVWDSCKAAFLALHGSFGEDGLIQGYLECIGMPYTGSGVYASAVAMNKIASKHLFIQNGIPTPPYSLYGPRFAESSAEEIARKHGFPCFVKCPQSGSSRLMGRASNLSGLTALLEEFSNQTKEILVETAITGTEFTCGVLEDDSGKLFALPPVEIRPKATFFDYTAKYSTNGSEEIVPAPQPPDIVARIQETACRVHEAIGCYGVSRTDMILSGGTLYVLETNTLPGLTSNSLIPKSYNAIGGSFTSLIDTLIKQALRRSRTD